MSGTIAGGEFVHAIDAQWVLDHQYLQFHETTVAGETGYEAQLTIGWDEPSGRYVCLWLDSTGGGGLSNGVLGWAEKSDNELAFDFAGDSWRFHTTFSCDKANDVWVWTMDSETEGQLEPFARMVMRRR